MFCYEKFERMLKLHSFLSCFTKLVVIEKALKISLFDRSRHIGGRLLKL